MDFTLRLFTPADTGPLLEFERVNRRYFEEYVPPRPEAFFNEPGAFELRMAELFEDQAAGKLLMFALIGESGSILGRLNLSKAEGAVAMLGYRVAQAHTGNGLISAAIQMVEPIARQEYGFTKFCAYAAPSNPASVRTLLKAGFTRVAGKTIAETLHNAPLTLQLFEKALL